MGSHKVSQVEFVVRTAYEQRASLFKTGDVFAGEVIVCQQAATVLVSLQCLIVKDTEQAVHVNLHAHALHKLSEQTDPCV